MRRERRIWSALFAATVLATSSGIASAKDAVVAKGHGYTVTRDVDGHTLRIRTQPGVNVNTPQMANAIGTTPFAIRAENPTATLALCESRGQYAITPGIRTVEGRRTDAVWVRCAEQNRYVYVLPSSTLTVSGRAHRKAPSSRSSVTTAPHPTPVQHSEVAPPSNQDTAITEPASAKADAYPASRQTMPTMLLPVIRTVSFYAMGALAGLLTVLGIGFALAMRRIRLKHAAQKRSETEIIRLRLERDKHIVANRNLAQELEYYKSARQFLAERLDVATSAPASPIKSDAEARFRRESAKHLRASQDERRRADKLDAEYRCLVQKLRSVCGEQTASGYIERMPAALLGAGVVELVSKKLGISVPEQRRASFEETPGHVTQRMYSVVPPVRTALPAVKEDSGIRLKADAGTVPSSDGTSASSMIGREVRSGFPTGLQSVVRTERNMPVVRLPLVHASEPPVEYEVDDTAPYQWPGSTKLGLHDNRRIPKGSSRQRISAA